MKKKKGRVIWFFVLVMLIASGAGYYYRDAIFQRNKEKIFIAVVAPLSGGSYLDGQDMLQGVQLLVEQVNQAGGLNGRKVEILKFDDQNNAVLAEEKAQEIVDQDKALVVIGHAFSSSSNRAGVVYEKAQIPAITGSATADEVTENRDWYFRVIPNSHSQAVFMANYLWHIMGYKTATVIHDTDAAGVTLATPFESTFRELGGEVNYVFGVDRTTDDLDDQLKNIVDELKAAPEGDIGAIFFATKVPEGISLIVQLDRKGVEAPMFGSSAFSNIDFIEGFKEYPEELAVPGYYSDDFYAISPVIFDVAGRKGQDFREDFLDKFGTEPGMKAATNYDAVLIAIEAMKNAGISGTSENRAVDRQKIRDYLANIDQPVEAVDGVTGSIHFDEHGNIVKSNYIGVYKGLARISALTQLQPIKNIEFVTDLEGAMASGDVFVIDDQYMYKTDVVYTGIDYIEVSNLNTKNSTYTEDFYLWFRYKGDVDAKNIEFVNTVKEISLGDPIIEEIINGENYVVYRVKTDFLGDFLFHDYPFDRQELAIKFKHASLTRDRIIYVVDFRGMEIHQGQSALEKILESEDSILNIGSWIPIRASFFQDIVTTQSTLGNPNFFGSDPNVEYSRFNGLIEIERDTISFGLKNLLPLLAVTVLAYLSAFLPVSQFAIKNAIGRGALMTVAFFHIKLSNDLPGIGYSVALDYVFYTMYVLIVVDLVVSVVTQNANNKENQNAVRRLTLFGKVFYPAFLVIVAILFSYQYGLINFYFF